MPAVFMGVILLPGPEIHAPPLVGVGFVSMLVPSFASVVANVCFSAAIAGAPPDVSTFQAK